MHRIFDIAIISILVPIIIIIYPLIYILVLINLGRPAHFVQHRSGLNDKIFKLYKFRSMRNDTDDKGEFLPDEIRITKFGNFLRNTSLDEIPSLINVIKGDLSFIGPRPLLPDYIKYYSKRQSIRNKVRPGITGLAQIKGRNLLDWETKFEFDVYYILNRNIIFDICIFLQTIIVVVNRRGINDKYGKIVKPFKGS